MAFKLEQTTHCSACDTKRPAPNICSPYERLTGAIFDFNFCPYCGRQLKDTITAKQEDELCQ